MSMPGHVIVGASRDRGVAVWGGARDRVRAMWQCVRGQVAVAAVGESEGMRGLEGGWVRSACGACGKAKRVRACDGLRVPKVGCVRGEK